MKELIKIVLAIFWIPLLMVFVSAILAVSFNYDMDVITWRYITGGIWIAYFLYQLFKK